MAVLNVNFNDIAVILAVSRTTPAGN